MSIDRARVRRPSFALRGRSSKHSNALSEKENEKELHTDIYIIDVCCCGLSASPALRWWWLLLLWLLPPLNPCTCALVAIVVLAGCRLALSFSILVALNGVAVTHIVPRAAIGITSSVSQTLRAGKLDTPREGEHAISQLGQDIRTNDADSDDGEDDVTLTRRHTRRDGTRDCVRPLGFTDPSVPIASINAEE